MVAIFVIILSVFLATAIAAENAEFYVISDNYIRMISLNNTCNSGLIEFYYIDEYGTFDECNLNINDRSWNEDATNAFCLQLGFKNGGKNTYIGSSEFGGINLNNINITGEKASKTYEYIESCYSNSSNICGDCDLDRYSSDYGCGISNLYDNNKYNVYIKCNGISNKYECNGPYNNIKQWNKLYKNDSKNCYSYNLHKSLDNVTDAIGNAMLMIIGIVAGVIFILIICICICCGCCGCCGALCGASCVGCCCSCCCSKRVTVETKTTTNKNDGKTIKDIDIQVNQYNAANTNEDKVDVIVVDSSDNINH